MMQLAVYESIDNVKHVCARHMRAQRLNEFAQKNSELPCKNVYAPYKYANIHVIFSNTYSKFVRSHTQQKASSVHIIYVLKTPYYGGKNSNDALVLKICEG